MSTVADLFGLALRNHQAGNLVFAEQLYQQILQAHPGHADSHHLLGVLAYQTGRHELAVQLIGNALGIKPMEAVFHFNLGAAQAALQKWDEAKASYELALRQQPDFPEVHNNFGNLLQRQGKLDDAVEHWQEALRLRPGYAEAHHNWSDLLLKQDKLDEVIAHCQAALRSRPDYVEAHNNLGCALHRQCKFDEAMAHYEMALRFKSDYGPAHWNRSLLRLLLGDFERGWPGYEMRWTQPNFIPHRLPQPLWDGSPLGGRTIFLYAEQGLGDTLQFIRYAALVKDQGGTVIFECQPPLLRLLAGVAGIDHLLANGTPLPLFDVQVPLLSLPGIFKTKLETIPASVPYLDAEPGLVAHWRDTLQAVPGYRIGIAWQGNPQNVHDLQRSIPLTCFAPLAAIDGVRLVSLQHGLGAEQIGALEQRFSVVDLRASLGDGCESLANIAAIMKNLDLVITCDTAIAHLAGAMGVAVWVALPMIPDWRWLLKREDSPWYPGIRLFRQKRRDDWDDVFERMAAELRRLKVHEKPQAAAEAWGGPP